MKFYNAQQSVDVAWGNCTKFHAKGRTKHSVNHIATTIGTTKSHMCMVKGSPRVGLNCFLCAAFALLFATLQPQNSKACGAVWAEAALMGGAGPFYHRLKGFCLRLSHGGLLKIPKFLQIITLSSFFFHVVLLIRQSYSI